MRNIYKILNLFVLLIVTSFVQGQQIDIINNTDVIEHIKLNTDRDLYFYGEDIFFTADYFINNEKSYPVLSNKLYLELIETVSNTPILQKKYKISDFKVNGQIHIPIDVASGSYLLRAYTPHQRNFSAVNFSSCYITILNSNISLQKQAMTRGNDSIYIAVEGDVLLDNIKSNIVFMLSKSCINSQNRYLIEDETGILIKELYPNTLGLIQTEMIFSKSKKYKFKVIKSNGDTLYKEIPKVQTAGIQTSIRSTPGNTYYKIRTKGINKKNENPNFQIKIFSNNFTVKYRNDLSLNDSILEIVIPAKAISNGINYITLTNKNGNIKKLNSVFKSKTQINEINIVLNKDTFKPAEEIEASISTKNENRSPVVSVSVTRIGTRKEDHGFLPALHLNNPIALENYFNSRMQIDDELKNQIMVLFDKTIDKELFTAKTEKVSKKDMEFVPKFRDNNITGILRNKNTKEPASNYTMYLVVLFNNPQIHVTNTNESGEFIFSINNVYGKNDIFLCYESYDEEEANAHEILVKSSFSSEYPSFDPIVFIDNGDTELIKELYHNAQIQQRFNKKQDNNSTKQSQIPSFNIKDTKTTILPDNYIDLETMQELFYEVVHGVVVREKRRKNKYVFKVLDENNNFLIGKPLILVDHIPVFNTNSIMELDPSQIEKIEVIHKTYILGAYPYSGVIMITTNIENFSDIELPKSATFTEYQGLEVPNHNFHTNKNNLDSLETIPDFRTTLYWNPQIKLTNEEQVINFNASDRKGTYNIIIEGFNSDGQAYYGKKQITIE